MLRCEEILPRLSDIIDGRLNGNANDRAVELHVSGCSTCQAALQKLRAVGQLAVAQRELFPAQANDAFFESAASRLMAQLEQEPAPLPNAPPPFPAGDIFDTDLDSFAKLDASEATGIAIPTAFVAARRESSVLFTLQELHRMVNATKPQQSTSKPEGSGLLDGRALAQMRQQMGQAPFSRADATLQSGQIAIGSSLPLVPPQKPKKTRWGLIAFLGAMPALAAIVLMALFLSGKLGNENQTPPAPQIIVQAPTHSPSPNGTTPNNTVAVAPTPTPTENPAATPTPTPTPTPTATPDPKKDPKVAPDPKKDPKTAAPTATPKEPAKPETPTATPTPEPKPEPKPTGQHKDELDDLLGGKSSGGGAESSGPAQLSSTQINSVMSKANFAGCKAIGTGKVQLKVTINSQGSVTGATGDGSPLSTCVIGVVRKLKFPSISSASQTFPYPVYVKE